MNLLSRVLTKDFFLSGFGRSLFLMKIRTLTLAVKFALTLYLAKFFGLESLGLYGLIVAGSIIVPVFLGLSFSYTISRRAVTQTPEELVETLHYYGRFLAVLYLALMTVGFIYGYFNAQIVLGAAVFFVVLFEHINTDIYNYLLNLSRPVIANILHFVRSGLWIIVYIPVSYLKPELRTIESLLFFWIAGGIVSFLSFVWIVRHWPWKLSKPLMPLKQWVREEFAGSRTIYVSNMINSLGQYSNQFIVSAFLGLEMNGVLTYYSQIFSAMVNLMQTGIIQVSRPRLVKAFQEQASNYKDLYRTCMKNTLFVATAMAIAACPVTYYVTKFIDRPLALDMFGFFVLLMFNFLQSMVTEVNNLLFYSQHRDDLIFRTTLIGVFLGTAPKLFAIPLYSLWGAAGVSIITAFVVIIVQFKAIKNLPEKQA